MAKRPALDMNLPTADDLLFSTQEERDNANREYVKDIPLDKISDFPNHPFKVQMDEKMREIYEETGLSVRNLVPCGVVHWAEKTGNRRYIEFLYRTSDFSGNLVRQTDEGSVFWMDLENLCRSEKLSHNFNLYLPLFLNDNCSELFFEWDGAAWDGIPQYFRFRAE